MQVFKMEFLQKAFNCGFNSNESASANETQFASADETNMHNKKAHLRI